MHELSIAINIVDIAAAETKKAGARRVTELNVDVGSLSGVIVEALAFAMEVAVRDTVMEKAKVNIHQIQARARCRSCGEELQIADFFELCPKCNSSDLQIIQGQELQVRSLNVV